MQLADFLSSILSTHGKIIKHLEHDFGEQTLLKILENLVMALTNRPPPSLETKQFTFLAPSFPTNPYSSPRFAIEKLKSTVAELHLSNTLEFYLLSYPFYRAFIESPIALNANIANKNTNNIDKLASYALLFAKDWIIKLPISQNKIPELLKLSETYWLRFRWHMLRQFKINPLVIIYSNTNTITVPSSSHQLKR
ncbi:MAG: hypothetical protein HY072_09745 [Deltaproteobacteria bacterium]|nr:hypothetical protein [Deltaproteobacteria bacterium]